MVEALSDDELIEYILVHIERDIEEQEAGIDAGPATAEWVDAMGELCDFRERGRGIIPVASGG